MTLLFYLSRSFLLRILLVWILFVLLIVLGDTIETSRFFGGKGDVSYQDIFLLAFMRAPYFAQGILPFAILFASLLSLYLLSRRLELVIVRSTGISVWQFLTPFCAVAVLVGLFTAMIYDPLSLYAYKSSKVYQSKLLIDADGAATLQRNTWVRLPRQEGEGDTIIRASVSRDNGIHLTDVSFYLYDGSGNYEYRYDSPTAFFTDQNGEWGYALTNARHISPDSSPDIIPSIFVSLNVTTEQLRLTSETAAETDFWQLRNSATQAQHLGRNPLPFATRHASLLSLPLIFLTMVLISSCVSLLYLRFGSNRVRLWLGIFSAFIFYIVSDIVLTFGENGLLPIFWVAYIPSLIACLLSFSVLLYQEDG